MTSLTFENKHVVVSGASGCIGAEVARAFAERGAYVYLLGRDRDKLEGLANELMFEEGSTDSRSSKNQAQQRSDRIKVFDVDLQDTQAIADFYKSYFKTVKQLDVLIHAAGLMPVGPLMMQTIDSIEMCMQVNLLSVIQSSQLASRLMIRQKSGVIINLSSVVAQQGAVGQAVYAASKAGLEGFSKSLSKELAPMNVRVVCVAPGLIDSPLFNELPEDTRKQARSGIALERLGSAADVARLCTFLASDDASYMTGQTVALDGGISL